MKKDGRKAMLLLLAMLLIVWRCAETGPSTEEDVDTDTTIAIPHTEIHFDRSSDCLLVEKQRLCIPEDATLEDIQDAVFLEVVQINTCTEQVVDVVVPCAVAFACNPAQPIIGEHVCDTSSGEIGRQTAWCDKGFILFEECIPCLLEICNGEDDDCDGFIDNLLLEVCSHGCEDGFAVCLSTEKICLAPLPQSESCNLFDDDCDGLTDEDIIVPCATACGPGEQSCILGGWSACSSAPAIEICDGTDNDCNGAIDDGIICSCEIPGMLIPCAEPPLTCGQGFKQCECNRDGCSVSPCTSPSCFSPSFQRDRACTNRVGAPLADENACNHHDEDCDGLTDEALVEPCYFGPEQTLGNGSCIAGEWWCADGHWGSGEPFEIGLCGGQVLPMAEDLCNGVDENCDGFTDQGKEMQCTDIVLVLDVSGSMQGMIQGMVAAFVQWAELYKDESCLLWALAIGPVGGDDGLDHLVLITDFVSIPVFLSALAEVDLSNLSGSAEMIADALWLILGGSPDEKKWWSSQPITTPIGESMPPLDSFGVIWRNADEEGNAIRKLVVVATDESFQSYLAETTGDAENPKTLVPEDILDLVLPQDGVLDIYIFRNEENDPDETWKMIAESTGGTTFPVTSVASQIFENLMEILNTSVCK